MPTRFGPGEMVGIKGRGSSVADVPVFDGRSYPVLVAVIDEVTLRFQSQKLIRMVGKKITVLNLKVLEAELESAE